MRFRIQEKKSVLVLFFLVMGLLASGLEAQYFGRNKVQYEKFDFKVMKTKHFDIYFYPEFREAAEQAGLMAERWHARLSRILNHELKGKQPLILYASSPHFQQTTAIPGVLGEGTGGVTESFKRRIILPLGASLAESDHVIGHELVHAFQFDMTSQGYTRGGTQTPTALRLPLWFIEGLAEYLSIGPVDAHTAMWMREAVRKNDLPTVKKLNNSYKYFPYRYGHAIWSYITGRWGDEVIARIMRSVGRTGEHEKIMERVLGISMKALSEDWHKSLKEAYEPVLPLTQVQVPTSRVLFQGTEKNVYNVSPSVSPDGKDVISLSTRDLFSIDMYLADTQTGKIKQKITKTATDPEFESIQFIKSSGAWDFEGKQFVFGAISKGMPILSFYNVREEKIEREISFPHLGEILNPTWSPDGRFIAFSALAGGVSDLFIYDMGAGTLKRLTEDVFADLHPAWSPDGRSIAFVTDRFSTNLSLLSIGNYQLALIDPQTGHIQKVKGFDGAKNINPQWSPDSQCLYFLSDQNGKTDIYRTEVSSGRIFQVTNLYTGVSGITELSPALSFAHDAQLLAYSAYEEGRYTIYAIDSVEALRGTETLAQVGPRKLSVLPPREQPGGALLGLLRNPLFGLPEDTDFQVSDYKSKLSLDYVSPPQLAIGVDRYGTYGGGGVTLFWSDMLGYHTVATMAQTSSRFKDTAALVGYQNSKSRWNWGGVASRIPYLTGSYAAGTGNVYGEPAYIEQELLYWQINYDLSGFVSYPFNQVRRVEFSGGYRYIDFDQEIITQAFSLYGNYQLLRDVQKLPSPPGLHFGYASAALVYDSSIFGATSPLLGQSYILEVSPVVGSISYNSILADYRRYFVPVRPFTLAFRILHFGRYGKDAEDDRLWPLYIGYDSLVRGYDYYSFNMDELSEDGGSFDFDRLLGSKMIVANAELRFPLFGLLGLGRGYYGILPIDFLAFYDIGLAWTDAEKPDFLSGGIRKPVSSAGIGLRMNVMGYLILGLNYVQPFDRPNKGWYFQLSLTPGF